MQRDLRTLVPELRRNVRERFAGKEHLARVGN
jgi:hypothetical protein